MHHLNSPVSEKNIVRGIQQVVFKFIDINTINILNRSQESDLQVGEIHLLEEKCRKCLSALVPEKLLCNSSHIREKAYLGF